MLQRLSIQNYAIIDELEIDFSDKLNVITGETGAGKSIIVGALGLILGERADSNVLVNKEKKCFVEGVFEIKGKKEIKRFLEESELDSNDELIIRREIGTNGKSRAFVNDTPVTLSQLNELCSSLVDLHQQFDTLQLGKNDFHREVLDALAGHSGLLNNYQQVFTSWQRSKKEWEQLKERKQQFEKEFDYNQFQYNELEEAAFRENDLEELDAELKRNETPIVQQLKILLNQLQGYSSYHPDLPALMQRIQSVTIELLDIADETNCVGSHINYD